MNLQQVLLNLKSMFLFSLVNILFVDICFSLPRQQSVQPSKVQPSTNAEKLFTLEDFLNSNSVPTGFIDTKMFQDILSIIKDESSRVVMPSGNFSNTREVMLAFLRLDMLSTARRVLSREPATTWFPQGPGVGDLCYDHLMTYFEGLIGRQSSNSSIEPLETTEWALRMFDSVGKPNAGLLAGRLQLIGDYDQCVGVSASKLGSRELGHPSPLFRGRYCRVRMPMAHYIDRRLPENVNTFWLDEDHLPININWGVCVPDTCSQQDIRAFLTQGTFDTLSLPVEDVICFQDNKLVDDPGAMLLILLLTVLGLGVVLCTGIDLYTNIRDSNPSPTSPCWCLAEVATSHNPSSKNTPTLCDENKGEPIKLNTPRQFDERDTNPDLLKETPGKEKLDSILTSSEEDMIQSTEDAVTQATDQRDDSLDCKGGELNEGFEISEMGSDVPSRGSAEVKDIVNSVQNQQTPGSKHSTIDMETKMKNGINLKEENTKEHGGDDSNKATEQKSVCYDIIKGVSLCTNFVELMNTEVTTSKRTIRCIEGLKAITMAWVVLGHTYTFGGILDENNIVYDNALEMTNIPDRLAFHIGVGSAQFGVDTFFVICGCLVMFISLDKLKQAKQKWQFWTCFIFRRFWRLTPIYMVVLAIGTNLYDHIVYGPLKAHNLEEFNECREKWWAHLLYINNLYRPTQKCMTWTWYLAVDMQLHVLSPFFIYPVYRTRRLGAALIVCLLVLSMVSAFASELMYGGQFLLMDMNFLDYWSHVYTVPWARASAFAIGLLLGVVLRDLDNGKPKGWEIFLARKWCQRLFTPVMWTLNISVGVTLALVNHDQWKHGSGHWEKSSLAVFECLSRPLWSLAVAWVIFACNTGRAGPIAKILSFSPFVILSRLSYSVYLLHPIIILFVIYSRRTAIYLHPDRIDQVYNYLGNLVLTHLFAVLLYLFVEAPLRNLDMLWEPRRPRKAT